MHTACRAVTHTCTCNTCKQNTGSEDSKLPPKWQRRRKSASGRGGGGGGISIVNPKKLETRSRTNSAGIPYTLLLRTEAIGFPTFGR